MSLPWGYKIDALSKISKCLTGVGIAASSLSNELYFVSVFLNFFDIKAFGHKPQLINCCEQLPMPEFDASTIALVFVGALIVLLWEVPL